MNNIMTQEIIYKPIGIIHSPFRDIVDMPIQTSGAFGIAGTAELFESFQEGLKDLDGFSHIMLLYHFHKVIRHQLLVTPFLDSEPRGVFATRAPKRPNPLGLSVVELVRMEDNILHIQNVDILDGTPLLDIKPYVSEFDHHTVQRIGWLEKFKENVRTKISDDRFR